MRILPRAIWFLGAMKRKGATSDEAEVYTASRQPTSTRREQSKFHDRIHFQEMFTTAQ